MGALAPLSYLVYNSFVALANVITIVSYNHKVITILNYERKTFLVQTPGANYKTFYGRKLRIFVIG